MGQFDGHNGLKMDFGEVCLRLLLYASQQLVQNLMLPSALMMVYVVQAA